MTNVANSIREKLTAAFQPQHLSIVDESARHAGHKGARPEGESHFAVRIVAAAFDGVSRLERQRMVHGVLAQELAGPVHALSLSIAAPDEA